jgi:glycosyltransferase involved in cell wall biosynthesis
MKIAFLNYYQENVSRGAETFVKELAVRLSKKHQVEIISDKEAKPQSQVKPKFFWRFFVDSQSLTILKFTFKNLGKIWREKYNVIIPLNGGWQPALIRVLTWFRGGKMVIAGQSGIGWDDINNLWSFPSTFVAISSYAANWARAMNPFCKVSYIPNGVDTKKFIPEGEVFKHGLKSPVVLTVAALTKTKRVDLVIKAVSETKDLSLLICGRGEEKQHLQKLGDSILRGRFRIIEADFSELPKIYRSANLFSLVSESFYAFEIVLLEAMATNLPVIANQDPIRAEIVGKGGVLVNPEDIKEYAKVLDNTLKGKWDNLSRNQAKEFDWDKVALQYEELFIKLTK